MSLEQQLQPTTFDDVLLRDMDGELREGLQETLQPFHTMCTFVGQVIRQTNVVQHLIDIGDARPRKPFTRRIPFQFHDELDAITNNLLMRGVITASASPWVAPVYRVKKNAVPCVFASTTAVTMRDSVPLPQVDGFLQQLAGKRWFSKLNFSNRYW